MKMQSRLLLKKSKHFVIRERNIKMNDKLIR